jgi:DNA-binding transcriptional regulator YiaG
VNSQTTFGGLFSYNIEAQNMTISKTQKQRGRQPDGSPNRIDILVGNRIRQKRLSIHLSQQQLADKLHISFQQLQKYESGQNRVSASRLWDLSQILNEPVGYFFENIDEQLAIQSPRFSHHQP